MITKYIKGDIRDTELNYIAHGVNCQKAMGSGVAKALYEKWPIVKEYYHKKCARTTGKGLLGEVQFLPVEHDGQAPTKHVINMFTQEFYGYDGRRYLSYMALVNAFMKVIPTIQRNGGKLAIPKIGCGLAGGKWEIVEELINELTGNDVEVWVYHQDEPKRYSKRNDLA